ncbi:RNA polymerase sigma factor [Rubrobacter aplysinae]|uniref:RNA polymerase sigma factor n=1 Tax=Rubrobacter aplysinae TaxID=909625 RepID=UPI00069F73ED|nr:RNA polymerase sigma factor [Rubrobacter aplysinae]
MRERPADTDRLLIQRLARGEARALDELYGRFGGVLFGYLLALSPHREAAEEILQDTFVAAWRAAGSFEGRSSVKTWLFAIARRRAHEALRRRSLPLNDEGELEALADREPDPEKASLTGESERELADCISRLSSSQREALVLVFFQEFSYAETAEVLGVPIGTVKSRLSNAKRSLRTLMTDPEGPGPNHATRGKEERKRGDDDV